MLTRAFTKPKKSFKEYGEHSRSWSISEYDDGIVGLMDDIPLISCENHGLPLTLKEVLRTSVGVMGANNREFTEKVVLSKGRLCALKRFRKVLVGKSEFGRRVERLAQVCRKCEYLVPITAYLYTRRFKLVLCDYYPMGSLADLLEGGRRGQTALIWNERLMIIVYVARAIAFIHAQCPPSEKNMKMNVHGNIKSSNIMINIDLTALLSDYGFVQLADCVEDSDHTEGPGTGYCENLSEKSDIFNFGLVLLDVLGGVREPGFIECIVETKESIKLGKSTFFEFDVQGRERRQALKVLDIALACTNRLAEARPSIEQILLNLGDILNSTK
ncbi:Leucine-rich repeat protein kinase family protein, putative [Theobroma cacao]|uniref:Leucine-rich repeat protein kinase family protein, putative n=1 Tax=Theobroma cacao TaxID=3641 RepID=A0A061G556_THECC|nr:Leucine-rich repeat protein kinase family protein, putative [Theobroma cacao]